MCIFCKIAAGEIPSTKVYESADLVAFLDLAPMGKGHTLIVPKQHWDDLASVPATAEARRIEGEMLHVARTIQRAALNTFAAGANLLQCTGEHGGQTVGHLHIHVIPRLATDPVPPTFESNAAAYADDAERDHYAKLLREEIARLLAE